MDLLKSKSRVEEYLTVLLSKLNYNKWFGGHLHQDRFLPEYKLQLLYNQVIKLNET